MQTPGSPEELRGFYDDTADSYSAMMDAEIDLPVYADVLGRLAVRIAGLQGTILDVSCGSGHMLSKFHQEFDSERDLVGIDFASRMVEIAGERLGSGAKVMVGDMRSLPGVESRSAAAVLNFFAIHHLGADEMTGAFREWHRVLGESGQLVLAAWEGSGEIDYGEVTDLTAFRYSDSEIAKWATEAGFQVDRCVVEDVPGFPMNAVYLEATKVE